MTAAGASRWILCRLIGAVACSTIVRITIETAAAELDKVSKEQIFERFADKAALAKAVNIPVEHVSWDIPLWSDW